MLIIDYNELSDKIEKAASEQGLKIGKFSNPMLGDATTLTVDSECGWAQQAPIAHVRCSLDYSRLIIEELPVEYLADEHTEDYPANLVKYSPKIKSVADSLDNDPQIGMEVVLVTRYSVNRQNSVGS